MIKKKKRKILVTGGAGFIGHHLINELIKEENNEVFIIDNMSFGKREYICNKNKLKIFEISLVEKKELHKIINIINPTHVFHLGAIHYIPYCVAHPEETFNVNVMGTSNLLEALLPLSINFLFFSSTAAVYKPDTKKHIEDKSLIEPMDIYGASKLICEKLIHRYFLLTKKPTVIGRLFNVYGPEETNPHLIPSILNQINYGKRVIKIGNLFPKRDYIYIDDIVSAFLLCCKKIKKGFHIFNIGTSKSYSVKEVLENVNTYFPTIIFKQDNVLMRKVERKNLCSDINKIRREIGWKPKYNLEDGLKRLISFYQKG